MESGVTSDILTVDIEGLLHFFDEKPDWGVGHATGIISIVGEDLGAACLQHCIGAQGGQAMVLRNPDTGKTWPVKPGGRKGPWLDRWIRVNWPDGSTAVFQTEIKSWSSHGYGGIRLPLSASPDAIRVHRRSRWDRFWDSGSRRLKHPLTVKVLKRMKPPEGVDQETVRPLLIFWEALGPGDSPADRPFQVEVDDSCFPELSVFSVSGYLRSLRAKGIERVELEMPDAVLRLRKMNQWFSI